MPWQYLGINTCYSICRLIASLISAIAALAVTGLEKPHQQSLSTELRGSIHLLLNLEIVNNGGEFAQNLVSLLVVL
jgi:hypothetical protein